jgi:serine/threonine protein kinase
MAIAWVSRGLCLREPIAGGSGPSQGPEVISRSVTNPAPDPKLGMSPAGFPRQFDSYVLLKPLARGGMGQLYLALAGTAGLEKLCVVKQVPPDVVAPENARRFRDEAMVALRLSHGNLVPVFDAGLQGDRIFLAMDFVDGRDLHAVWNRCAEHRVPFPVDIAVYVIKELCRGLAYAHAFEDLKLVHRDVSPGNVLLSFSGEVKLTDFGLATSTLKMERTAPGIIYGKLSYLAPEQARREQLDGRTDLYAAGILLWELLTGRQLFPVGRPGAGSKEDADSDALQRARNPEAPAPSTVTSRVPPALDRIVLRALAPERQDRYPDGEAMRADLAAFLAETSPKTDAARLVEFLRPMYADELAAERRERQALIAEAKGLLSGVASGPAHAATVSGPRSPSSDGGSGGRAGEDPRVGTTLGGRYYVRRLCGEGAMGRVYEGHHIDIGRRVAIKVLHASFHTSADLVERFRREARAASKIGHANIVDVTDSGTTPDGAFYFVMEYLDGTNLEELIDRNGPLAVERALLITAQIARALEAAHAADVIHRDLKPANVMLVSRKGEDDFVKVLDFGISKDLDLAGDAGGAAGAAGDRRVALTRPDVAIGTPVYMSPEQAAGRPADALTDVYAVGGLLYEMLTGCPPCAGTDAIDVLHKKAHEDPVPVASLRPNLPVEVDRLITRALSRAPRDRHPSMAALKDGVLACLGVVDRAGTGPTPMPSPLRGATQMVATSTARVGLRRLGRGAIGVAAGAAGLVALGIYLFVERTPPGEDAALAVEPAAAGATEPASPPARLDPPVAPPQPAPKAAALDTESTPWPERESLSAASKRAEPRFNTTLPAVPSLRRELQNKRAAAGGTSPQADLRGGAPIDQAAARAPATRRASVAAIAETDPAHKAAAAMPERPAAAGTAPSAAEAILGRGQAAFDRGDYPEAVRRGREAIAAGGALGGHLLVGDAYYRLERFGDALREYQAALALDPGNASIRRRRDLVEQAAPR